LGSWFVYWKIINTNSDKLYSSGDILSCFLGVIYGIAYIGMSIPNIKAITEGRIAGKMAYDVILREPKI
jgi:hypothetical protein